MGNDKRPPLHPRLHEVRAERGWSQKKLAELVGTTPVNISRWENGSTFPSPHFRQKLSKVFGKTLAELGLVQSALVSPSSLPSPQPQVLRIWNVPITRNPFFTGRESLLALLYERLSTTRMAALIQAQALYGLGGIGKTQTAAEYTFRYGDEYAHVFWTRAATRDMLAADFVKLAQLLDLPEKDGQDQPQIVDAVKLWLSANEGWLLILDNADDLPLAQEFLPTSHKGYVLFTTRSQAAGAIAASVEVEKLTPQEGVLLLLRWSKRLDMESPVDHAQPEDRRDGERIVAEMDGLPLALVQAGAYVEETGCSLADYLNLYATHRKALLARRSRLMLDYPDTVATTWSLSFQRVEQQSSAAADVLRLCAFLAPDAIPEDLLIRGTAESGVDSAAPALDPFKLNEALEVLLRYSLVRRDASAHMLSIHRLVQIVLKENMDRETRHTWAQRTVQAVNAIFPEFSSGTIENQSYYLQYYLPHVQECASLIAEYQLHAQEATRLLYQAGTFLYLQGFYPQSQALHQQTLAIREQIFGIEHLDVADSLNALAILSRNQGDYEQAESFHRQALAIRKKILGLQHTVTAESINNLGVLYRNQRKYEEAEPLLQQALSIREQSLGPEHLSTLFTSHNLAKLYAELRKYEQAEQLLNQALAIGERILEPEHPFISQSLTLLARVSYEQGNYEQAEMLAKKSLALIEKAFGPEHPLTAERLNALAELYFAQGRYALAQSFCQKALRICERTLGSEHPDTIFVRKHLANIVSKRKEEQEDVDHPAPPAR